MRYRVTIYFGVKFSFGFMEKPIPLIGNVKTLREAMTYKELIDESVSRAYITDLVTGKQINLKDENNT